MTDLAVAKDTNFECAYCAEENSLPLLETDRKKSFFISVKCGEQKRKILMDGILSKRD